MYQKTEKSSSSMSPLYYFSAQSRKVLPLHFKIYTSLVSDFPGQYFLIFITPSLYLCLKNTSVGWLVGYKANYSLVGPGPIGGMPSVGGLSKRSLPVFTRVLEKTTEKSERLGRQMRPGFEPGTSRFPVLSTTTPPFGGAKTSWSRKDILK